MCKNQDANETQPQNAALSVLKNGILKAGEIPLKYLNTEKFIENKSSVNLLTIADKETEEFLVQYLIESFPDDGILAEEGHEHPSRSGNRWVIDPIDGTTSYAHGFPAFTISAALVDAENHPILGVVYHPLCKEMYSAVNGQGAWMNGKPIKVSGQEDIQSSLIGTGFPYNRREIMDQLMKRLSAFLHNTHDIRRTGSASLDICYVAMGRLDGYYEGGLQPWDTAAASLIAQEAGAVLTKFDGSPYDIFFPEAVIASPGIHPDMLRLIRESTI